ncbi:MAG: hypothetical protein CSA33_00455 [Desulfobulbus propionicus]|nr:MAG: hypothetical protein CSA33_00455 [Desulfobulbus propionicus]
MHKPQTSSPPSSFDDLNEIKLFVSAKLYSAFHRCIWLQVHETGKNQLEIMQELVEEYLKKHQC